MIARYRKSVGIGRFLDEVFGGNGLVVLSTLRLLDWVGFDSGFLAPFEHAQPCGEIAWYL